MLVTGATGFVGAHTRARLEERGYEVHPISRRTGYDLLVPGEAERAVAVVRPTHLLHLAWEATPGVFWGSTANLRWLAASVRLVEAFRAAHGERIVIAGTCAEYDWRAAVPFREAETPTAPATLYGSCKHALRLAVEAYAAETGLSAAWGRIFFVYGPGEPAERLISSVTRRLLLGDEAPVSSGIQVRDFLYAPDLADALAALVDSEVAGPVNLASGEGVALRSIVETLGRVTGRPELVRLGALPGRSGEPTAIIADVSRLTDEVGWSPSLSLEEGLARTVDWWRKNL